MFRAWTPAYAFPVNAGPVGSGTASVRQFLPAVRVGVPRTAEGRVLAAGAVATLLLIVLSKADTAGLGRTWQSLHWNLSAVVAFVAVLAAARTASGRERQVRAWVAAALGLWMTYNLVYSAISWSGSPAFPSVADVIGLLVFVPAIGVLVVSVHGRLTRAEETAVFLDAGIMATSAFAILLVVFGPTAYDLGGLRSVLVFAYPLEFLAISLAGVVALVAVGYAVRPSGAAALLVGSATMGVAYLALVIGRGDAPPIIGFVAGPLFSIGTLVVGLGGATWRDELSESPRHRAIETFLARTLGPIAAGVTLLTILHGTTDFKPLEGLVQFAIIGAGTLVLLRQGLLLRERTETLAELRVLHDENDRLVDELRNELTERARVQDQLIDTSRMAAVGELAAGVAHEVNNPLTGVLLSAELLLTDIDEADPRHADVETIRSEALRARAIVRALRDFARPTRPEPVPTVLADLIVGTLDLVRYPLVRAGVTINETHGEMEPIQLDPQAIQQVILNVLTNAMQAMPDGGHLEIESSIQDGDAVVRITDDGVGMDEDVAAQAFVPFFSGRREVGGAGLGLSVSLGLIESHRGTIRLTSRRGAGTTVEIRIPVTDEPALVEAVR